MGYEAPPFEEGLPPVWVLEGDDAWVRRIRSDLRPQLEMPAYPRRSDMTAEEYKEALRRWPIEAARVKALLAVAKTGGGISPKWSQIDKGSKFPVVLLEHYPLGSGRFVDVWKGGVKEQVLYGQTDGEHPSGWTFRSRNERSVAIKSYKSVTMLAAKLPGRRKYALSPHPRGCDPTAKRDPRSSGESSGYEEGLEVEEGVHSACHSPLFHEEYCTWVVDSCVPWMVRALAKIRPGEFIPLRPAVVDRASYDRLAKLFAQDRASASTGCLLVSKSRNTAAINAGVVPTRPWAERQLGLAMSQEEIESVVGRLEQVVLPAGVPLPPIGSGAGLLQVGRHQKTSWEWEVYVYNPSAGGWERYGAPRQLRRDAAVVAAGVGVAGAEELVESLRKEGQLAVLRPQSLVPWQSHLEFISGIYRRAQEQLAVEVDRVRASALLEAHKLAFTRLMAERWMRAINGIGKNSSSIESAAFPLSSDEQDIIRRQVLFLVSERCRKELSRPPDRGGSGNWYFSHESEDVKQCVLSRLSEMQAAHTRLRRQVLFVSS